MLWRMVRLYAVLCVLGAVLPLWFFGSFLADEGLDFGAFVDQLTASDIALFAWADVVVTGLVVIVFAAVERVRRWWLAVVATLFVGPSLGLPLLLLLRERERTFDAVHAAR
jgi:Terpene cyclase DEP1